MKINNVIEIFDNGEFVTIITSTGQAVHLPNGEHSITIVVDDRNNVEALIEFNAG